MTSEPPPPRSRPVYDEQASAAPKPNAPFTGTETSPPAEAAEPAPAPGEKPRPGWLAIGLLQVIALLGVVTLAVIAGAILVDDTKVPGWIDGLAIGTGSVILTLVVLFNGQRALRSRHRRPGRRGRGRR